MNIKKYKKGNFTDFYPFSPLLLIGYPDKDRTETVYTRWQRTV